MIKVSELRAGDLVIVDDDGVKRQGTVMDTVHDDHQALVDNGIQEFWYDEDRMEPIPVNDASLAELGFTREENGNFTKYSKGAFRLVVANHDFSEIEMWYREDRRHYKTPLAVHQLQNHYHAMTKVYLEKA